VKLKKRIGFGIYKGIGDYIGVTIASRAVGDGSSLIIYTYGRVDCIVPFGPGECSELIPLGVSSRINLRILLGFISSLLLRRPDLYVISDFSVSKISASKIIQLIACRLLFIPVAGSRDDVLSFLYNKKLPSTTNVELIGKDYFYLSHFVDLISFDQARKIVSQNSWNAKNKYKYIVHIGASTANKRFDNNLLEKFLTGFAKEDCCVIGAKSDFANLTIDFSAYEIDCIATSFEEMVALIRDCDVFIGFDSAAANIANLYRKKIHIISGPAKTENLYQKSDRVKIHRSQSSCQACGMGFCKFQHNLCMSSFNPSKLSIEIQLNSKS